MNARHLLAGLLAALVIGGCNPGNQNSAAAPSAVPEASTDTRPSPVTTESFVFDRFTAELSSIDGLPRERSITVEPGGAYAFAVADGPQPYAAKGTLRPEHLRELLKRVTATRWLASPGAAVDPRMRDGTRYHLIVRRGGHDVAVDCYGDQPPEFAALIAFLNRLSHQEELLWRLTLGEAQAQGMVLHMLVAEMESLKDPDGPRITALDYRRFEPAVRELLNRESLAPGYRETAQKFLDLLK